MKFASILAALTATVSAVDLKVTDFEAQCVDGSETCFYSFDVTGVPAFKDKKLHCEKTFYLEKDEKNRRLPEVEWHPCTLSATVAFRACHNDPPAGGLNISVWYLDGSGSFAQNKIVLPEDDLVLRINLDDYFLESYDGSENFTLPAV